MTDDEFGADWGDALERQIAKQEEDKRSGRVVSRAADRIWGESKMGRDALAVSPDTGFALKTIHGHFDEVPAGSQSGRHRHASEAIMLCIGGRGYTVIEDVRHDWEEGDCFVMPSGAWHQHFNRSQTEPAKYFTVSNWPMTVQLGLSYQEFSEVSGRYGDELE